MFPELPLSHLFMSLSHLFTFSFVPRDLPDMQGIPQHGCKPGVTPWNYTIVKSVMQVENQSHKWPVVNSVKCKRQNLAVNLHSL